MRIKIKKIHMKKFFIAVIIALFSFQSAFALTKLEERKIDAFLKTAEGHLKKWNVESAKKLAEKILVIDSENVDALEILGETEDNSAVNGILDWMDVPNDIEVGADKVEPEVPWDTINDASSIWALIEEYKLQIGIFTVLFTLWVIAMFMPSQPKKKVVKKVVKKEAKPEEVEAVEEIKAENPKVRTNEDALKELEEIF